MRDHTVKWLALRFLIVAANIGIIASIPAQRSNIDWPACFLISSISALGLLVWLRAVRSRQNVDWSKPYSWRQPFWPMARYPLRFWFLAACALTVAGSTTMTRNILFHQGHESVPATFLFMGLFMMVVLKLSIRRLCVATASG